MRSLRSLLLAISLAVALAFGQYAALLHGLGHATEQLSHKPGTPAKIACDQCFGCSQLASGAPSTASYFVPVAGDVAHDRFDAACEPTPTRVVFLSRAPPVLS